jgi:CubicO group peptidase (beta-lactamase class C family)
MQTSTFRPTMAMTRRLAQGHEGGVVARPAADNASGWPAGSLFSSVQDLAQFCIAFLNGGRGALTPGVITKLSTGYVEIPGTEARYGYGLRIARHRGVRLVSHAGNRRGYGSSIRMVPDERVAVIVLVNQTGGDLPKTAERALEMLAPLGPPSPPASRPVVFGPDLARYTGVYVQGRERLEVFREGGQLMLREEGRVRPLPRGALFLPEGGERVEYLHRGGRSYRKELSGGQQLQ